MSNDDGDRRNRTEPPADEYASDPRNDDPGNDEFATNEPRNSQHGRPTGEQRGQTVPGATAQASVGDILQEPDTKEWVKAISGAMAVVGLGLGVLVFLLGAFGGPELTRSGMSQISDARYKLGLVNSVFQIAPFIGFAIVSVSGLLVGFHFDASQRKRLVTASASAFVGLVALVMLAEVIASMQAPSSAGLSLDYGQALVNSVLLGVVAAIISGGATYSVSEFDV